MHKQTKISVISVLVILLVAGFFVWKYIDSLNSPLSVLNILNPRTPAANSNTNTSSTNTSTTDTTTLISVPIVVPDAWKTKTFTTPRSLELPKGFSANVFASGFTKSRFMTLDADGRLFVSDPDAGTITVLPDENHDGIADAKIVFAAKLNYPHGLAFYQGDLYVAETDKVEKLVDANHDLHADSRAVLVSGLAQGGNHVTRTIVFDSAGKMYVSVGSSCNVCVDIPQRAAILQFDADGKNEKIFASGLRNSVGLTFHPQTNALWATDNGRDLLGDDIPPDEVNSIQEGKNYGWPYCYDDRIPDPKYHRDAFCKTTEPPTVKLQAHSAPLGLRFYTGSMFPAGYTNQLFVAFHGSWNRRVPTGYKVVVIDPAQPTSVVDFARGWLVNGKSWGRPVDVLVADDGALFISDDRAGVIYRIAYHT